jgi:GTPase
MQITTDCKQAVRISREVEEGNVEHKWKLLAVSSDRLVHLTTQLNWRLNEGRGNAIYMLGYTDGGDPSGLPHTELLAR